MASNRDQYPAYSYGIGGLYLEFSYLAGGGTVAPLVSSVSKQIRPLVTSFTRTAAGVNVVTFADAYLECYYKSADVDDSLGDGAYGTAGNFVVGSGQPGTPQFVPSQVTIRTYTAGGALTDLAANRLVNICFRFRNSTGA